MPEENTAQVDNATQGATAEKLFTQAEVDAIVGERSKRWKAKYADYDEAKAALDELTQLKEASKTELQKAVERAEKAEAELSSLKAEKERAEQVAKVAAEQGVDAALLSRMNGDVEENAAFLKAQMDMKPKYEAVHDAGETKPPSGRHEIPKFF